MNQIRPSYDINLIQNIPLLNTDLEDDIIWMLTTHGHYTVKSFYHNIMDSLFYGSNFKVDGQWKQLWNLRVQPKFKHLTWCIIHGCLPSRQNLIRKRVLCQSTCSICENELENDWYLFRMLSSYKFLVLFRTLECDPAESTSCRRFTRAPLWSDFISFTWNLQQVHLYPLENMRQRWNTSFICSLPRWLEARGTPIIQPQPAPATNICWT